MRPTLLLLAIATAALLAISTAGAQTVPTLRCASDNQSPQVGALVNVACTLTNNAGAPVPNTPLTFYVNLQSKTDASFAGGLTTQIINTDAAGKANGVLRVGDKPGTLGILVNYPGIYSFSQVMEVRPASPPPPSLPATTAPLLQPAPVSQPLPVAQAPVAATDPNAPLIIRPPSTGDAGLIAP